MELGRDKDGSRDNGAMNLSSRPASAATDHPSDADTPEVKEKNEQF